MTPSSAHQSSWETSEVVFGIPLLISLVLGISWPFHIASGMLRWVFIPIGVILFILGVGLMIAARRELAQHSQPTDPGKPTTRIVESGVFSYSRNPLYLGIVILVVGVGLILNYWWVIIMLLPEILLCHFILIFPEEHYLSAVFGEEYQVYKHSVYRWVGKK